MDGTTSEESASKLARNATGATAGETWVSNAAPVKGLRFDRV